MKNVLLVGDHPFATSGNAGMLHAILSKVDTGKFNVSCFALDTPYVDPLPIISQLLPFSLFTQPFGSDVAGNLLHILNKSNIHALVIVGLDIWYFKPVLQEIAAVCEKKDIRWAAIFPYDLQSVRKDWVDWINLHHFPCVYSKYGERLLKPHVKNIRYFRPPLHVDDVWKPMEPVARNNARRRLFPTVPDDAVLFGFIGNNQFRKDPQGLIKAFSIARNKNSNIRLFMHTDFDPSPTRMGIFNLSQYAIDCGVQSGDILKKSRQGGVYKVYDMPILYNCFDVLINCTIQEGLSWTPLEAMLCGVPVIASNSTAHIELIKGAGGLVSCEEPAFVPVETEYGKSYIDAKKCRPEDIASAMLTIADSVTLRKKMRQKGLKRAGAWLAGTSDINRLLGDMFMPRKAKELKIVASKVEKNAVLFVQHSAAGDVFMTTRCFKGIKERYAGQELHYMTMPQYVDILKGNPYIDKVISWNDNVPRFYPKVLNPHGERIAPGHWGRNCNTILSDFYWKILDVVPDDFFIEKKQPLRIKVKDGLITFFEEKKDGVLIPKISSILPICILHTTGGDPKFRTYKYMADVAKGLQGRYLTVQLGSSGDFWAGADVDLRGKLSFRQSAWVVSKARLAVTVDSFMSHLCGALGVSQVCLFGSGNYFVVKPNQVQGELVCMSPDYVRHCPGLGPCSASIRTCSAPCTGRHDPKDILKAIQEIENKWIN
uniref:Putative glycosyltransferase n=1 Tax=viral metagenome TaxID=1070528 RepID=A0A6M3K5D3_9ZZZZ